MVNRRYPLPPLSTRGWWHRASMLGTFVVLLAFPWVTTTGCEGKSTPTTWYGFELLHSTWTSSDWPYALGPLVLALSCACAFAATRTRGGRRLLCQVAGLVTAVVGVFATFVAVALPTVADVERQHAACALGLAALLGMVADAFARAVIGSREWWLARHPD